MATVARLIANPGPDGISLREALQATNNDPGKHTIRFAPSLTGRTIVVGALLESLAAGGVSIDGDIDGDGRASVTLRNGMQPGRFTHGLRIESGGNSLRALSLEGFDIGVAINVPFVNGRPATGRSFEGNTVDRLMIRGAQTGVFLGVGGGECERKACETRNRWTDLRIVNNTIEATDGINVQLNFAIGEQLEGLTITGNSIRLGGTPPRGQCLTGGAGVNVVAGQGWAGVKQNRIADVVIARNSISGNPDIGIRVVAGSDGADANVVERVRVNDNRIDLPAELRARCIERGWVPQVIVIATGDYLGTLRDTNANDNVLRDVEVRRNRPAAGEGVRVFAGGANGARNTIRDLRITHNAIRVVGDFPGVNVNGVQGGIGGTTTRGTVTDVVIDANRIVTVRTGPLLLSPQFGGITIVAGDFTGLGPVRNARIERVRITNNRVDTPMVGISIVGGFGSRSVKGTASDNVVLDVLVTGNNIVRAPMRAARLNRNTRGINIVGGIFAAKGNRVACVRLRGNHVAGVSNAVSVVANVFGASSNHASRGGC